jgi:nicotinate-nucleotide adenylyltransferase
MPNGGDMRLGILGGSFDPVHFGHLRIAEEVRENLSLEKVLFIPAPYPPHKGLAQISSLSHRLRMVELAIMGNPGFELSRIEEQREGPSFTIETVREVKLLFGSDAEVYFIAGSDSAHDMFSWKDPFAILSEARVVVVPRPGFDIESVHPDIGKRITIVEMGTLEISATDIRRRVSRGKSVRYLTPAAVIDYIEENGLYLTGPDR